MQLQFSSSRSDAFLGTVWNAINFLGTFLLTTRGKLYLRLYFFQRLRAVYPLIAHRAETFEPSVLVVAPKLRTSFLPIRTSKICCLRGVIQQAKHSENEPNNLFC